MTRVAAWTTGSSTWTRARWMVELLLLVAVIGWLDLITGAEVGFALFYLMPVMLAGWRMGRTPALVAAACAAIAWFIADLHWHRSSGLWISVWNGSSRLVIFVVMGILTSRVRSDRARMQALLARAMHLARTDALTGLANSRSFYEQLETRLRGSASPSAVSLVYMDVDNFKNVNDREGHKAGDDVLRRIASAIDEHAQGDSVVARLGGDEFGLAVFGRDEQQVGRLVESLVAATDEIGRSLPGSGLGLSAGVVHASGPAIADDLVRRADETMYRVKTERRLAASGGRWRRRRDDRESDEPGAPA